MIRSLSYQDIYYDIRKNVSYEDFYKGRNYFSPYLEYLGSKEVDRNILHEFHHIQLLISNNYHIVAFPSISPSQA